MNFMKFGMLQIDINKLTWRLLPNFNGRQFRACSQQGSKEIYDTDNFHGRWTIRTLKQKPAIPANSDALLILMSSYMYALTSGGVVSRARYLAASLRSPPPSFHNRILTARGVTAVNKIYIKKLKFFIPPNPQQFIPCIAQLTAVSWRLSNRL